MKALKKLTTAIVSCAFILSSASAVLADETTAGSQPSETASSSETQETFDISKMKFETMYGNQIQDFLGHQYVFDGQKIPVAESNFYFLQTFLQLSQYAAYGYFPATSEGYLDLAATYDKNGKTYSEYFVQQAEEYIQSTYILLSRAKAAGLKLTDEDKKIIDDEIKERTEQQAKPAGVPLETILKLYFGPDCDEKSYRLILENATLAGRYQEKYQKDYKIPEDQLMVPNIRYALFYAPGASATDEEKKKAETSANDFLKQCKSIADLKAAAEKGKEGGTVYNEGEIAVRKGEVVSTFEEWAYDASRKEGDIGVIYSKEYGYFVVGYAGKVKLDETEIAQVASEALNAEIEAEMKADKHGFKGDKAFPSPKAAPTSAPKPSESSGSGESSNSTAVETLPTSLPTDNGTTAADNGMSRVLIIIFVAIGGLAFLGVIAILVSNHMSAKKEESSVKKSSKSKKASKDIDDPDEIDEEDEYEYEYEEDGEEVEADFEEPAEETEDIYSGISEDEEEPEDADLKKDDDKKKGKKNKRK